MLLAPLRLVDRLGLRPALRAIVPRTMRDWLDLLPPLEAIARPLAKVRTVAPRADAPSVVVHHGCVAQVLANSENLNSERLLAAAGYRVVQLEPTSCCGALDLHSGNAARALEFARANVRALKNLRCRRDRFGGVGMLGRDRRIRRPAQRRTGIRRRCARGFLESPRPEFLAARRARASVARISVHASLITTRVILRMDSVSAKRRANCSRRFRA